MSAAVKLKLSRLGIIGLVTAIVFASIGSVALAQAIPDMADTAEKMAGMDAMQLLAYIALCSIAALVLVIRFYVTSVSAFQKEIAAALASITVAVNDLAKNCKACK